MSKPRTSELYITAELAEKLRMAADVTDTSCADEYAERVLTEHIAAKYPNFDAVLAEARKARKKVIEDAKAALKIEGDKLP
jgi:short-subunit dehydrogenase involved in D-alanine esterification of teichoic acids